jgi:DNA-binding response OmpR family regulator
MSGKIVLLIEDNVTLAIGLETCLKAHGFGVQRLINGQDAYSACIKNMPDLIVTDIMMREMDGVTFLQNLRDLPGGEIVPVIVISGAVDQISIDHIKTLGVQQLLIKPFALDCFLEAVGESLRWSSVKGAL